MLGIAVGAVVLEFLLQGGIVLLELFVDLLKLFVLLNDHDNLGLEVLELFSLFVELGGEVGHLCREVLVLLRGLMLG